MPPGTVQNGSLLCPDSRCCTHKYHSLHAERCAIEYETEWGPLALEVLADRGDIDIKVCVDGRVCWCDPLMTWCTCAQRHGQATGHSLVCMNEAGTGMVDDVYIGI